MLGGLALLFVLAACPALADTVTGRARILDGDTIEIGPERIWLFGIDAPESGQRCTGPDRKFLPAVKQQRSA